METITAADFQKSLAALASFATAGSADAGQLDRQAVAARS